MRGRCLSSRSEGSRSLGAGEPRVVPEHVLGTDVRSADDAIIRASGVYKTFASGGREVEAVRDVSFEVAANEFVAIIGPSGCGKSTFLNMVAGFMRPTAGSVLYRGDSVPKPNTRVGYITQKDHLLPWRSVRKNIELGLEFRNISQQARTSKAQEMIRLVGLDGFEDAYPAELSGGMRKRVALGRTLVYEPETLLADEPFGALDAQLKLVLSAEFQRIWSRMHGTVLFVTHDIEEAISLADRVLIFSRRPGRLIADVPVPLPRPRDVYEVKFTDEFREVHGTIWQHLRAEVANEARQ